ncbi:hypothetical protein [Halococcus salifodinae]|uniref:hypothetical protein n=1 Tax=Halococcus salifodinae TaxID=36738 RepID=UPI00126784D6|nr:hypothetical protein [Halococcus salifodinae]
MSDRPPAVHVHVHRVMAGAFPLRVADLLFTDDTLVVPEYRYLTPLSGILRGRHEVGAAAAKRYREAGVGGLVEMAERIHRIAYADIERVRIYDGRSVGRPKVTIDVTAGPPYAYRVHAPVDVAALTDALTSLGRRRGFGVEHHGTLGFDPRTSLRRFLADR